MSETLEALNVNNNADPSSGMSNANSQEIVLPVNNNTIETASQEVNNDVISAENGNVAKSNCGIDISTPSVGVSDMSADDVSTSENCDKSLSRSSNGNGVESNVVTEDKMDTDQSSDQVSHSKESSITDNNLESSDTEHERSVSQNKEVQKPDPNVSEPVPGCSSESNVSGTTCDKDQSEEDPSAQGVYHIKWIIFKEQKVPIVTQNENGPCPLLAIMNILLVTQKVKIPAATELISADQLMGHLGECLLNNVPEHVLKQCFSQWTSGFSRLVYLRNQGGDYLALLKLIQEGSALINAVLSSKNIQPDDRLNFEQNMHDAMAVIPKLQTGLDVNVKFTGVGDFEYTPECIIFDLLQFPLYHGWLVDPQDMETVSAVSSCSYNQLVEKIISQKSSDKSELVTEALVAENFLERSAAQLTYHGLCELISTVKENQLCVLFRNNHFSTLYRHKNELFVLVTDQGFLNESNVVWETLSNVEGDGHFVDASFRTYTRPEPAASPIPVPNVTVGSEQQIDQDYLVALTLQQEQQMVQDNEEAWQNTQQGQSVTDHQLARRLQEEEDRRAATATNANTQRSSGTRPQPQRSSSMPGRNRHHREGRDRDAEKKEEKCVLL